MGDSATFNAETCPNCKGTGQEPLAVFTHPCDYCKGGGKVSHFKMALWIAEHPEESIPDTLPEGKADA